MSAKSQTAHIGEIGDKKSSSSLLKTVFAFVRVNGQKMTSRRKNLDNRYKVAC